MAAFFVCQAAAAHANDEQLAHTALQAQGLRLFDQAVKLGRRFDAGTKQAEPLKSLLIELSDYHGEEQAGFLAVTGGARGPLLAVGPWALQRLARLEEQLGEEEEALPLYERLGTDFKGGEVVFLDPASGGPIVEKAEVASLRGKLAALAALPEVIQTKDGLEQAFDMAVDFQKNYGSLSITCGAPAGTPCGTYGPVALQALWELLAAGGAPADAWEAKTLKLEKYEADPKLAAAAILALSQGYARLGKPQKSKDLYAQALKKYPGLDALQVPEGAFKNLTK